MKRIILTVILVLIPLGCVAGEITGTVKKLKARSDGLHLVYMNGTVTNKPACSIYDGFAIKDEETAYGKSQFSLLLTALASGKEVKITGEGGCTRYASLEDISAVEIAQ